MADLRSELKRLRDQIRTSSEQSPKPTTKQETGQSMQAVTGVTPLRKVAQPLQRFEVTARPSVQARRPVVQVESEIATGLFRIFQESLTNVLRHSKATEVTATLSLNDGILVLSIADNGIGFNATENESKKTLGLLGMKERTLIMGGTYEITSKPGNGTTVVITVPINNHQA